MKISTHIQKQYEHFLASKSLNLHEKILKKIKMMLWFPFQASRTVLLPKKPTIGKIFTAFFLFLIGLSLTHELNLYSWETSNPITAVLLFILQGISGTLMLWAGIGVLAILTLMFHPDTLFSKKLEKEFRQNPQIYSKKDFEEAAETIRRLKPDTYENQCKKYSKRLIDLLIITYLAYPMNKKIKRIVSLKAIEENREADARDDEIY